MTLRPWPLPPAWDTLVSDFLDYQRARGLPPTTISTRRQQLSHLARGIGASPEEVTGEQLVSWTARQEWGRETRRSRRTTFRAFWSWGVQTGRLKVDASASLPKVRAAIPAPRPLPEEVLAVALADASPRVSLIIRLAVRLGLRRAEIAQIHTSDIVEDIMGRSLVVHGKGARQRVVPLPEDLAHELESFDGYVFPGRDGGHLSPRYVGHLAAEALPQAWTLHAGRHRFATLAHRASGDLLVVQDLLGHASPSTTRTYIAPDTTRARAVVDAVAKSA